MRVSFARIFRLLVQRFGDQPALVNAERGRCYTFRELDLLSNQIANMMSDGLGLGTNDRYLLILQNDNLSLMHFWTILKARAAAVFTNVNDSIEEHLRQIEFLRPKCVFIESEQAAALQARLGDRNIILIAMDGAPAGSQNIRDFWSLVSQASAHEPDCEQDMDNEPAFYRFTGGTTGSAKCARYSYRHIEQLWHSFARTDDGIFSSATRFLHFAPLSHGTFLALVPTFFAGGCNVTQNKPDLTLWCENVEQFRISASFLVPTLLYRLLTLESAAQRNLSSLSTIVYGGAPMSPSKLAELQGRFGNIFAQIYGATESFGIVAYLSKADHLGTAVERLESCGRPVAGVELMVADEQGRELPPGDIGELWHRHRGVITGYFGNDEASAAEFAGGWWKSGDLARMSADGYFTIVDRKKDMIISGGFNIYATEVEAALSSHPAVLMCVVVGVPHPEWGEAVLAEVVCREGVSVPAEELIGHVKRSIGSYKAPKSVVFVQSLPVSSVGKVIRKDVRARYWEGRSRNLG